MNKWKTIIGVFLFFLLVYPLLVLVSFWSAWWVVPVWNGFMVPFFHAPIITMWQFVVFRMIVHYFVNPVDTLKPEYKIPAWEILSNAAFSGPLLWFGWKIMVWWIS